MLLATSVDHDRAPVAGIRVNVLLSRYLIEPCGSGKSKLTYMCRIDLRYGFLLLSFCAANMYFTVQNLGSAAGCSLVCSACT